MREETALVAAIHFLSLGADRLAGALGLDGSDVVERLYEAQLKSDLEARARLAAEAIDDLLVKKQPEEGRRALQAVGPRRARRGSRRCCPRAR